jgi:hypothetical protein
VTQNSAYSTHQVPRATAAVAVRVQTTVRVVLLQRLPPRESEFKTIRTNSELKQFETHLHVRLILLRCGEAMRGVAARVRRSICAPRWDRGYCSDTAEISPSSAFPRDRPLWVAYRGCVR